jgi:hypothetical protein
LISTGIAKCEKDFGLTNRARQRFGIQITAAKSSLTQLPVTPGLTPSSAATFTLVRAKRLNRIYSTAECGFPKLNKETMQRVNSFTTNPERIIGLVFLRFLVTGLAC